MAETLHLTLAGDPAPRLDKALAAAAPEGTGLSRSRIQALLTGGAVSGPDGRIAGEKDRPRPGGTYGIRLPDPDPPADLAEDIALDVIYEDATLAVINKPAGMVVHPAPGARSGTLVNALVHRFGASLLPAGASGRPGIVHRIDKDTSGILVVARTPQAHQHLSRQFAAHQAERTYVALVHGAPEAGLRRRAGPAGVTREPGDVIRIEGAIGRHPSDRKRMAIAEGGRRAVTRVKTVQTFGPADRPWASLIECRLETGRTHQIRVHLAHIGHALIGDAVYGRGRNLPRGAPEALRSFPRQALHARSLGFEHPVSGDWKAFDSPLPPDMVDLLAALTP
jgi:23S rRNA pseudouridine1911/1915/1917 synthase